MAWAVSRQATPMRMASSVALPFGFSGRRDLRRSLPFAPLVPCFFRFLFFPWTVEGDTVLTDGSVPLMRGKYAVFCGSGRVFLAFPFPHTKNPSTCVFFFFFFI